MNTTHLQGIGSVPAKPARELVSGDIIVWNYGYKSKVLRTDTSPTGKSFCVVLLSLTSGKISTRRFGSETLVAVEA